MNEADVFKVISVVLGVPVNRITAESSMDNVTEWDSLAHMNLIIALEDEFSVSIPDDDAANMTSVQLIKVVLSELVDS